MLHVDKLINKQQQKQHELALETLAQLKAKAHQEQECKNLKVWLEEQDEKKERMLAKVK